MTTSQSFSSTILEGIAKSYLIDSGGPRLEAIELSHARFIDFLVEKDFARYRAGFGGSLAVHQIDGEPFWVGQRHHVSASGSMFHLFNAIAEHLYADNTDCSGMDVSIDIIGDPDAGYSLFQIAIGFDLKRATQELLRSLVDVIHILVSTVSTEPDIGVCLFDCRETKIYGGEGHQSALGWAALDGIPLPFLTFQKHFNLGQIRMLIPHENYLDQLHLPRGIDLVGTAKRVLRHVILADLEVVFNAHAPVR